MSDEIRNRQEGHLYWVQASGEGRTWATASGAATALVAYVRDLDWTSSQTVTAIMDRGVPDHHKVIDRQPVRLAFTLAEAITGQFPLPVSGAGASVPLLHLEFKQSVPENPAVSGIYYQFFGVPVAQVRFVDGERENTRLYTLRALAMNGPTGRGYIG